MFDIYSAANEIDSKVAAQEAVSVYHMVQEGHSFRSAICNSKLIKSIYGDNPKFTCSQTKSYAIMKSKVKLKFHQSQIVS